MPHLTRATEAFFLIDAYVAAFDGPLPSRCIPQPMRPVRLVKLNPLRERSFVRSAIASLGSVYQLLHSAARQPIARFLFVLSAFPPAASFGSHT